MFLPQERITFTVLTNHQRGAEVVLAAERALGLGRPEREAVAVDDAKHLGRYSSALIDAELKREGARLVLVVTPRGGFPTRDSPAPPAPPPVTVAFHDRDRLFITEGPLRGGEAEFLRSPDGEIAWFRFGGRIMKRSAEPGS